MNWSKLLYLLLIFVPASCGIYSFSGVSYSENIKTVSIAYIDNNSALVAPELSPTLTNKLRNKFISQTNLRMTEEGGDIAFTGEVVEYNVVPVGGGDNNTTSLNRLQIVVHIKCECEKDKKYAFDERFTQFSDFDASKSLADVESDLIGTMTDNLVQDIFNKSALNW
ncbi:MAG: hypothetical protein GC181_06395 [Bacteroidetes bacterium]|nr:hypothetical protein [Bacteroidota bacterium]